MAKSNRSKIVDIVSKFEPVLRKAFLTAIDDITSSADLKRIVAALQAGDINEALRAVNLDPAAFRPLDVALSQAYDGGGNHAAQQLSLFRDPDGARLVVRFDARNPRAESWLKDHSSSLIAEIVGDQQTAIRSALEEGMKAGINPRQVALDIVGRIDPRTGNRVGGVIGLTARQEQAVQNFRAALLSDDPLAALQYQLRDKRYDAQIRAAAADGEGLDAATVDTLVTRYRASALKLRGDSIGRTEAGQAVHVGQEEAFQQAIDAGKITAAAVTKTWSAIGDSRTRETHEILDGQKVKLEDVFISPSGARLRFPHDPTAPAAEVINCRCSVDYSVNHFAGLK